MINLRLAVLIICFGFTLFGQFISSNSQQRKKTVRTVQSSIQSKPRYNGNNIILMKNEIHEMESPNVIRYEDEENEIISLNEEEEEEVEEENSNIGNGNRIRNRNRNEITKNDNALSTDPQSTTSEGTGDFNDVTLVSTADGMVHAIDSQTKEKVWSIDSGGPLATAHSSDENSRDFSLLPNLNDGTLLMRSGGGMRKTSVKARMLVEKAPFLSQEGLLITGSKTSRLLGVNLENGELLHKSGERGAEGAERAVHMPSDDDGDLNTGINNNDNHNQISGVVSGMNSKIARQEVADRLSGSSSVDEAGRSEGASTDSKPKTKGKMKNKSKNGDHQLWLGRIDYNIRAVDGHTGGEQFNVTYSELRPIGISKRPSSATRETSSSSKLPAFNSQDSDSSLNNNKGSSDDGDSASSQSLTRFGDGTSSYYPASMSGVPMPLIATPDGDLLFTDGEEVMRLSSPVTSVFSVRKDSSKVDESNGIISSSAEYSSTAGTSDAGEALVRPADTSLEILPLRLHYRMPGIYAPMSLDYDEEFEGEVDKSKKDDLSPNVAIVRSLHDGGLYTIEIQRHELYAFDEISSSTETGANTDTMGALIPLSSSSSSSPSSDVNIPSNGLESCIPPSFTHSTYATDAVGGVCYVHAFDYDYGYELDKNGRYISSDSNSKTGVDDSFIDELRQMVGVDLNDPQSVRKTASLIVEDPVQASATRSIIYSVLFYMSWIEFLVTRLLLIAGTIVFGVILAGSMGYSDQIPSVLKGAVKDLFSLILRGESTGIIDLSSLDITQNKISRSNSTTSNDSTTSTRPTSPSRSVTEGHTRVGSLEVSNIVLGYGSSGTVVLRGMLNSRPVAVKRMLSQFHSSADREISLLIRSDGHPNVVRYFLSERKGEFVYLALQLCHMSLKDFIQEIIKLRAKKLKKGLKVESEDPTEEEGEDIGEDAEGTIHDGLRSALLQVAQGIKHLHAQRIVHRDIKPHNILLALHERSSKDQIMEEHPAINSLQDISKFVLKISDMGLSKQLDKDSSSFASATSSLAVRGVGTNGMRGSFFSNSSMSGHGGNSASNMSIGDLAGPIGTIGWQAPELMSVRNNSYPIDDGTKQDDTMTITEIETETDTDHEEDVDNDTTAITATGLSTNLNDNATSSVTNTGTSMISISEGGKSARALLKRRTQTVDIFSLGCVFFFCIVPGHHPFGEWFEREANIMNKKMDLSLVEEHKEAYDLLYRMLSHEPNLRPTAAQICAHPFFWPQQQRLEFLADFSDRVEHEQPHSDVLLALECNAVNVVGRSWTSRLCQSLLGDLGRYRKYDSASVRDCLRLIRNKRHHFNELSTQVKSLLSPFLPYFESRYPNLLMHCYIIACKYLSKDMDFINYCGSCAPLYINPTDNDTVALTASSDNTTAAVANISPIDNEIASSNDTNTILSIPTVTSSESVDGNVVINTATNTSTSNTLNNIPKENGTESMISSSSGTDEEKISPKPQNSMLTNVAVWSGTPLASSVKARGWWRDTNIWISGGTTGALTGSRSNRNRPSHITRSAQDPKYRSRLCSHWEQSCGATCPMKRKGKCIFAHGPLELRVKESRRGKWPLPTTWNNNVHNNNNHTDINTDTPSALSDSTAFGANVSSSSSQRDLRSSGGEDVLGAARSLDRMRIDNSGNTNGNGNGNVHNYMNHNYNHNHHNNHGNGNGNGNGNYVASYATWSSPPYGMALPQMLPGQVQQVQHGQLSYGQGHIIPSNGFQSPVHLSARNQRNSNGSNNGHTNGKKKA